MKTVAVSSMSTSTSVVRCLLLSWCSVLFYCCNHSMKVMNEGSKWEQKLRNIKRDHEEHVSKMQETLQEEAQKYKKDLEFTQMELQMIESESVNKLEQLENSRAMEYADVVQEYEQKVLKLETELANLRSESQQSVDRASANIAIYKKKAMELEQQVAYLNEQLSISRTPPRPSFQYHHSTNMPEQSYYAGSLVEPPSTETEVMARKQPLQVNTNKKRVMFPAVKKRKLFVQNESGELL